MKKYYPYPARVIPSYFVNGGGTYLRPFFLDKDGTIYAGISGQIRKSQTLFRGKETDPGVYELVHDFGTGKSIDNARRLDNGKILAFVSDASADSSIWYLVDETNKTTTPVKNTTLKKGMPSMGKLSTVDSYGSIVLVGTYNSGGGSQNIYLSRDYGVNWKTIWDTPIGSDTINQHVHGVAYDRYRNYIWASLGDHDNATLICSDDWGKTWKHYFKQTRNQFMNITPLFDRLILDTDISPDGVITIPFDNSGTKPYLDVEKMKISLNQNIDNSVTFHGFATKHFVDDSKYPHDVIIPFGGLEGANIQQPVIMTYDGIHCFNIYEIARDMTGTSQTYYEGDIRIEYIAGKTPPNFTLNGSPYGNRAVGRGWVYTSGAWKYCLIDFEIPTWVCAE